MPRLWRWGCWLDATVRVDLGEYEMITVCYVRHRSKSSFALMLGREYTKEAPPHPVCGSRMYVRNTCVCILGSFWIRHAAHAEDYSVSYVYRMSCLFATYFICKYYFEISLAFPFFKVPRKCIQIQSVWARPRFHSRILLSRGLVW